MSRGLAWLVVALASACGTSADAPADGAASTAGACLGTADGVAHIAGGAARVGCPAGDPACDAAPPPDDFWIALPETMVDADDFAIDLREVSAGELAAWAATNDVVLDEPDGPPELPARGVPHAVAEAYCADLGKRLPRWFEWQLAAQGALARAYPWGDDAPTCDDARHAGCGDGPAAVGGGRASPCGVADLAGNVAEFLAAGDELPLLDDASYFFAGGSFDTSAPGLRSYYYRGDEDVPHVGAPTVGFRCASSR